MSVSFICAVSCEFVELFPKLMWAGTSWIPASACDALRARQINADMQRNLFDTQLSESQILLNGEHIHKSCASYSKARLAVKCP